jgi:hypothetical protein
VQYVLGTADGLPAGLDLRHESELGDGLDTGEYLAGFVARYVGSSRRASPGGFVTPPEMVSASWPVRHVPRQHPPRQHPNALTPRQHRRHVNIRTH